jgi:7-alpha-hydroxysteroid dehydrogenase
VSVMVSNGLFDAYSLSGRVAVITGSGRGIGAATAHRLAEAGADCVLVARTESQLDEVASGIESLGRRAIVFVEDVNDLNVLARVVDGTIREFGRLDVLVNNAGGSASPAFLDTRAEHLEAAFHFNVTVTFELSRLSVPHMLRGGYGSIVNIGSNAGTKLLRGSLVHGTTKAAINHMTRLMAADLAPRVRVNAVAPGAIETESLKRWLDTLSPEARHMMVERTPMRRNGTPDDIAFAVHYLASPASAWVTGKVLEVDGAAMGEIVPKARDLEP